MSEPRGPVRDSSLQDRKAPGNEFLRTPQPRSRNVMPSGRRRHSSLAATQAANRMRRNSITRRAAPPDRKSGSRPSSPQRERVSEQAAAR